MGKIIELNEKVSNLIAAGEVVERPLNVVKELVENSIDASSSYIHIHLTESGFKKIEIIDNGEGMDEEDALKAFKRHATSKLKNEQDLFRIHTLGFRGEAIPSIASVSEFILKTKKEDSEGLEIIVKGSKFVSKKNVAMNKGTHIAVLNLFYNTPARLKYLKSPGVELSYIVNIIEKLALSNPSIAFKLTNNGENILLTTNSDQIEKSICDVYGMNTFKNLLYFEKTFEHVFMRGYLSNSSLYKSRRNDITLIVNNRIVKNNNLIYEVASAYQGFIPVSKYPICILYIEIDPLLIDVNVSPSKTEIRFSNETDLIQNLKEGIIQRLKLSLYEHITDQKTEDSKFKEVVDRIVLKNETIHPYELKDTYIKQDLFAAEESKELCKTEDIRQKIPYLEYIGQWMGTYLLFQNEEGLYLFDQHACEEKINYENLKRKLENLAYHERMDLLIGFNLDFTKNQAILFKESLEEFNKMGFVFEENIFPSYIVRSVPIWLKDFEAKEVVEEVLDLFLRNKKFSVSEYRDELAKMIACKKSIKANHAVSKLEVDALLKRLNELDNPFTCPHGRPSIVKITNYEIEKMFKRVI